MLLRHLTTIFYVQRSDSETPHPDILHFSHLRFQPSEKLSSYTVSGEMG